MRAREIKKIREKIFLNKKFSDFELEELVQEVTEYKTMLQSLGMDLNKLKEEKRRNPKKGEKKPKKASEKKKKKSGKANS